MGFVPENIVANEKSAREKALSHFLQKQALVNVIADVLSRVRLSTEEGTCDFGDALVWAAAFVDYVCAL